MSTIEYAIIDIGSNSIRYAEEAGGELPEKEVYTTRLGSGLMNTGRLSCGPMEKSLETVDMLARRARERGFIPRAYATSAVRDAANGREFADLIERTAGVKVDILTGEQEARYAFLGAAGLGGGCDTMLDIGGASMQIVTAGFGVSFRAGCVRCRDIAGESVGPGESPELWRSRQKAVEDYMDQAVVLPELTLNGLVGVGGTITTLAGLKAGLTVFDPAIVGNETLTVGEVDSLIERLAAAGEKRREHPLLKERHDVILYGAFILRRAMTMLGAERMGISCSDGMEGFLKVIKGDGEGY